ncbi:RNA-directed DNA polymerase from mobile element jockey [Plakobranchus ocellatus]|uniref:RNA-directed DNA polymerase from mobile element jockey n=1 Tax=Plakobranchus ocellatus TaxID=259542 RepID=A0AAV4CYF8_9GAST|nr:RNA-directed DNA polymerase from mobile element jockey [Plakobranchus ocellatus]
MSVSVTKLRMVVRFSKPVKQLWLNSIKRFQREHLLVPSSLSFERSQQRSQRMAAEVLLLPRLRGKKPRRILRIPIPREQQKLKYQPSAGPKSRKDRRPQGKHSIVLRFWPWMLRIRYPQSGGIPPSPAPRGPPAPIWINKSNESAAGPGGVYYQFLRHLPESCLHTLLKLFNNIWTTGDIPPSWREASVVSIPKSGKDPSDPSNYRPIALTSCLCKTLEWMVNDRLVQVLESRNLLSNV